MKKLILSILSILTLVSVSLAIALLFSRLTQTNLEEENAGLRRQIENLTAARDELTTRSSLVRFAEPVPETAAVELARLRGEVTSLRREKAELEKVRAENQTLRAQQTQTAAVAAARTADVTAKTPRTFPRENWAFSG